MMRALKRFPPLQGSLAPWALYDNQPRIDRYLLVSAWHAIRQTIPVEDQIDHRWSRIDKVPSGQDILLAGDPLSQAAPVLDNALLEQLQIEGSMTIWQNQAQATVIERICIASPHLKLDCVQFFDVTDRRNTLVNKQTILPYRHETRLPGNLLLIQDAFSDNGLFMLKEAPCSDVQLAWPGFDFACEIGEITVAGIGVAPDDLDADKNHPAEWIRGYGFVTGVAAEGEYGLLSALRTYQEQIRIHKPGRDEMILLNTWGDRGQDTKISEGFALAELEKAHRLGITHFQLDDGWQTGRSSNSAFEGGSLESIWTREDYWKPHPQRFADGLGPVARRARELDIELCVWFNPSKDNSCEHWADDADALMWLNREYGIRTFKIDGVVIPDKQADRNLRAMFERVMAATNGEAVFNLDVTAGQRWGYHYGNEYGNIFLENRYTDWRNYYPHWTLRNLWMLSRYVPAQNLQIEFLNKWRNADRYPADDPLAPHRVPWDYCFAITIVAQPLAWFEATGLPEEAFEIAPLIKTYRQHQERIHAGQILPIGESSSPDSAPSGASWTGFQSIGDHAGYVIVYREWHTGDAGRLKLWRLANKRVRFERIAGKGADFTETIGALGAVTFHLPEPFSFALYRYCVV
jgi:hypothetical protein